MLTILYQKFKFIEFYIEFTLSPTRSYELTNLIRLMQNQYFNSS